MANSRLSLNLTSAKLQTPYKQLYQTVSEAIVGESPQSQAELEITLKKYKPCFTSLLSATPKNGLQRAALKKADKEPLQIIGDSQTSLKTIDPALIAESIILSDLFDINELEACELLLAGESHLAHYPGLTRGLIAILLYHDGRRSLVAALRTLAHAQIGRSFETNLSNDVQACITDLTDDLLRSGILSRILDLVRTIDVDESVNQMSAQRALGKPKHRTEVISMMKETRLGLAECVFFWSCQVSLGLSDVQLIVHHLRSVDVTLDGTLSEADVAVLFAFLYAVDTSSIHAAESQQAHVEDFSMLSDTHFIPGVHRLVDKKAADSWKCKGLHSLVQFVWSLTLRVASQHPNLPEVAASFCEEDEELMEASLQANSFDFFRKAVVESSGMEANIEYYLKRVHGLICSLIHDMPFRVKDMISASDDACRVVASHAAEGLEAPSALRRDLEHLVGLMASVYDLERDEYKLSSQFWALQRPALPIQLTLYNFLRNTGEHIHSLMFVPYLNLLTALSQSECGSLASFDLIRANADSPNVISWSHMFGSLTRYYESLRLENQDIAASRRISRPPVSQDITEREVGALLAVCRLVQTLATHSVQVRSAIAESLEWQVMLPMFGLCSCRVPAALKGGMLRTLSAFASSPVIAFNLWQMLDQSQLLPLIAGSSVSRGIIAELEEIESRLEDYPMLLGFLNLVDSLCSATEQPPASLGSGYRVPGFQPYLDFIINNVLLKFNTRGYKNKEQKWEVASSVLSIFSNLISTYEMEREHFQDRHSGLPTGEQAVDDRPAGHVLLTLLLQPSPALSAILGVVRAALDELNTYKYSKYVSRASQLALQLLSLTLEKQDLYLECLRLVGNSTIVSRLDKLLLDINPMTGRADHLITIARYVTMSNSLPHHALHSVRILAVVCTLSTSPNDIVRLFTATPQISLEIQAGLVEVIGQFGEVCDTMDTRVKTCEVLLQLLLDTVKQASPNIALYLLGYNLHRPVSQTDLQAPGMLGASRTCLHAVLSLINSSLPPPSLLSLAYQLIYTLCAGPETSAPTLRFLRTAHDFFYVGLTQPTRFNQLDNVPEHYAMEYLKQQTWFLKALAVELRITALNKQRSHTLRLVTALLDNNMYKPDTTQARLGLESSRLTLNTSKLNISTITTLGNSTQTAAAVENRTEQANSRRRRILQYLDKIPFYEINIDEISLEQFNTQLIMQVIAGCEETAAETGQTRVNVRKVHQVLTNELNQANAAANSAATSNLHQEMTMILEYCIAYNAVRDDLSSRLQALEAWRQIVELLLTVCDDILGSLGDIGSNKQSIVLEIITDLTQKCLLDGSLDDLISCSSGVILSLTSALCRDSSTGGVPGATSEGPSSRGAPASHRPAASSLQVLRGLLTLIITSNNSLQRSRANMYGALLYYIQLSQPTALRSTDPLEAPGSILSAVIGRQTELEVAAKETLTVIHSFGDSLLEVICRDACDGRNVSRMLALSCLDSLVSLEISSSRLLSFMNSRGFLRHLLQSLSDSNDSLVRSLDPSQPLRQIYIYDSTLSLLTQLGMTAQGANALLGAGVLPALAGCSVFGHRPNSNSLREVQQAENHFSPSYMSRYRQILRPCLKLCLNLLVSLGPENIQANHEVMKFVVTHGEAFYSMLRDTPTAGATDPSVGESLQDLSLLTSVLSRAAAAPMTNPDESSQQQFAVRSQMSRLQRCLVSLLPRYLLLDTTGLSYTKPSGVATPEKSLAEQAHRNQITVYIHNIAANLSCYCRNVISSSSFPDSKYCRVMFSPRLSESMARGDNSINNDSVVVDSTGPPALGLVVLQLKQACTRLLASLDEHQHLSAHVSSLTSPDSVSREAVDPTQAEQEKLSRESLVLMTHIIHLLSTIVENSLYITWKHLDFYLVHCIPENEEPSLLKSHYVSQRNIRKLTQSRSSNPADRSASERSFVTTGAASDDLTSTGITREQLDQLKQFVPKTLNEDLLSQLSDVDKVYSSQKSHFGYIAALSRRIRRLININCDS